MHDTTLPHLLELAASIALAAAVILLAGRVQRLERKLRAADFSRLASLLGPSAARE